MALLNAKHRNVWSAALSVASNRASKVALLRRDDADDIADRNAASLREDVEEFLRTHPEAPATVAHSLREFVASCARLR